MLTQQEQLDRIGRLPDGPDKDRAYACFLQLYRRKTKADVSPQALPLQARGWEAWYAEMFGQSFVDALAKHHREAVAWHWTTRHALIRLEREVTQLAKQLSLGAITEAHHDQRRAELDEEREGLYFAYFTIWSRGNMKTTIARRVAIADACITVSHGQGGYCLVISGTKEKVHGTATTMEALLTQRVLPNGDISNVWKYYPGLADAELTSRGFSKSWTKDIVQTAAGYVFHFVGLDQGMAGANIEGTRPTFILPDDIDNRKDSPVIAERNFKIFTQEVLPMGQHNTLVLFAQNLISRFSVMYRIYKQQARVLTNRMITEPVAAVSGKLFTETRVVNGIVRDVVVWDKSGDPTWQGWSRQRIQEEINREGLPAFLRECQHEVEESKEGLVLQHYDDNVQVITRTQFAAMYGTRDLPSAWFKYVFNDWARTKTKYHANVAGVVTVSAQNTAFPGAIFIWHPKSFKAASQPDDVAKWFLETISPIVNVDGSQMTWDTLIKSSLQNANLDILTPNLDDQIVQRRAILAQVIRPRVTPLLSLHNYRAFRMSHERTDVQRIYQTVFGLPFQGINPGGDGGLDMLNLYMKIDYNEPHPFRSMGCASCAAGACPVKTHRGFTKFFIVVDDGALPYSDALDPQELVDAQLLRYQLNNWRYRDPFLTVKGEKEGELLKMNDDFPNGLQMLFFDNAVRAAPLTEEEAFDAKLPVRMQKAAIDAETDAHEKARMVQARAIAERRDEQRQQQKGLNKSAHRNKLALYRKLK